jgi:hypothetical protein
MDDHESTRSSSAEQGGVEPGPFAGGGERDIDDAAAAALAALLDRKLRGLSPDCANDQLVAAAMIEAMTIVAGTADQVRRRLMGVMPFRPGAKPSRKRKGRRR